MGAHPLPQPREFSPRPHLTPGIKTLIPASALENGLPVPTQLMPRVPQHNSLWVCREGPAYFFVA